MFVSMKEMLEDANKNNYAILAINCFNLETARAVIRAAEKEKSPIIVNVVQEHINQHCKAELIGPMVKTLAEQSSTLIALNLDHGENFKACAYAYRYGFTSFMIDGSSLSLEENIKVTKEVVKLASVIDLSVEGELGHMSSAGTYDIENARSLYTDPKEVKRFFEETGIDALAISCGTAHGDYKNGVIPEINFDFIKEIKEIVKKPLVLHGASGSGDENIKKAVQAGINKINIGSDIFNAGRARLIKDLEKNKDINLFYLMQSMELACEERIAYYIKLSGSSNRADNILKKY